jgi:hypothetical protein
MLTNRLLNIMVTNDQNTIVLPTPQKSFISNVPQSVGNVKRNIGVMNEALS